MNCKTSGNLTRLFLSTAVSAMAFAAAPALAQDAPDTQSSASDQGLGEIVVTARKVSENLQDVPVAVTVLTGNDLEVRNVQRLQDIARFTPGMSMRPGSSTPSALTITLRGQVQSDILITLDPSVGTYVDGVYWARAYGLNGDFLDAQSVQVLKGPQGTLFGRNTTGGALLITSNNPDLDDFSGKASVTYGRFNEFQATGIVNLPIVPGKVGLRLAGSRLTRDGYTTNVVPAGTASAVSRTNTAVAQLPPTGSLNGLKFDNRDRWNFRGKLDVKPTDNLTLRFSGEYFEMDEASPAREVRMLTSPFTATNTTYSLGATAALYVGLLNGGPSPTTPAAQFANILLGISSIKNNIDALAADPDITSINEVPYAFAKTQTYGFTGILDTSFGQVQLITGYRKIDSHAGLDLDGSRYAIHFTEGQQSVKQYSGELQITGKGFDNKLDFAVGMFAFHESGFDQSVSIVAPLLNPVTSHFYGLIDNDSIGVYGQGTFHLTDQLSFTGGLRYSIDDKGLESRNNNYNTITSTTTCSLFTAPAIVGPELVGVPACAVRARNSFSGVSYTAGVEYKPNDDILLYAKTAKGFRSGGQNLRAPTAVFLVPFKPEIAYSYEVGFKGEFFDRRARLNLAAYQTDISNIQRSTLISNPSGAGASATVLGNAGKARFRGIEAELQAQLFEGFVLSLNGALTDPKYISYADLTGDRSFEPFDSVAEQQFGVAGDYTREFGGVKLKLHADYAWTGKTAMSSYNWVQNAASGTVPGAVNTQNDQVIATTTRPAMGILGARAALSFNDDMFEIAVFGRNITNNRAYYNPLLVAPVGYVQSSRMEPATYGVTATVNF
ncbi:iron complex outermembrane receptor protein [Novosphingobium kunmingense]|uniref:Iron complex outermembrane receptor protein n=1 Tax=Novosphingobium kunmingense TaxID=1211806 RepID=A0A2N0H5Z6_9SPHN|nr:TonB-dependent receptor [Novosphingobium kunmingense]PKB14347.1 iron complex outermembrane receptor protein [Novosphingobium kunmingense]